jgi:hypothetical protein
MFMVREGQHFRGVDALGNTFTLYNSGVIVGIKLSQSNSSCNAKDISSNLSSCCVNHLSTESELITVIRKEY